MPLVFLVLGAAFGASFLFGCHKAVKWQKERHEELKKAIKDTK